MKIAVIKKRNVHLQNCINMLKKKRIWSDVYTELLYIVNVKMCTI